MAEPQFILHHYEASPYGEKIRLMLGVNNAHWGSVISPPQPPRPNIDPLAGGYRRIPVAQVGADIFCDTALIADEVATFTGNPEINATSDDPKIRALVEHAEGEVFFAAITSASPLKVLGMLVSRFGVGGAWRFLKDRGAMMKTATVQPIQGQAAKALLQKHLEAVNDMLSARDYLHGDGDAPGLADFSVYHPLWLAQSVGGQALPENLPALSAWFDRVATIGHGQRQELAPEAAFSAARDSEPRALPVSETDSRIGKEVAVAPADYGRDPVHGSLVALTEDRIIVARETPDLGRLHVHFPVAGYVMDVAE